MSDTSTQIELRVWRQFLVLAEVLHFGRAAKQLNITQPPLTLAIQQLEARLGVPLFERTRRQVSLTPAGQALVEPVRQLLQQAAALSSIARTVGQGAVGRLRLGFVSTVGFGPLPGWLRGFRDIEPGIEVVLREATTDVQLRAFELGEADAGFVLHAPGFVPESGSGQALSRLSVSIEPMVLAVPESSPLTTARRLTLPQILAQPLIIFPREIAPSLYDAVLAFYHRHSASLVIAQEAIQMQTIVNLVSAGLGLAWVPQAVTTLQRPGVVYRRLPVALGAMAPRAETSLMWPSDAGPVVTRFVEYVQRTLEDDEHEAAPA